MYPARIAELLQPFLCATHPYSASANAGEESAVLTPAQLQRISMYIDILLRWNARINLTAVRDEEEVVTRHFGESLFAARHLFPLAEQNSSCRLADLGSGAGFPGLPIKIWAPSVVLTLIESNHKKVAFLREVSRALTMTGVDIQNIRAEAVPPAAFDVVTLRAVERFTVALRIGSSLVALGGRLALLIGDSQVENACSTLTAFAWDAPIRIPQARSRVLLVGRLEPALSTSGTELA
jgi:16S rRNA (guanine527-N7)-methyltransferase